MAVTFLEAAFRILSHSDKAMHTPEIIERAIEDGLLDPAGETPDHTMQATIWRDMNERRKDKSPFIVVGEGRRNRRYWVKPRFRASGKKRP